MESDRKHSEISETLGALSNHHCREVIRYLIDAEDRIVSYDELVGHLEGIDTEHDRKHLVNLLYHKHLPRLAEADLIEHDFQNETVRYLCDEIAETVLEEIEQEL